MPRKEWSSAGFPRPTCRCTSPGSLLRPFPNTRAKSLCKSTNGGMIWQVQNYTWSIWGMVGMVLGVQAHRAGKWEQSALEWLQARPLRPQAIPRRQLPVQPAVLYNGLNPSQIHSAYSIYMVPIGSIFSPMNMAQCDSMWPFGGSIPFFPIPTTWIATAQRFAC